MNFILKAKIEDHKLIFFNPGKYMRVLGSLSGAVEVIIRKVKSPRTNQQNRYYWGVIVKILSDELGYSPEDTHFALRLRFLVGFEGKGTEEVLKVPKSTTGLSTAEFERYQEEIRRWAATFLTISIPEPGECEV